LAFLFFDVVLEEGRMQKFHIKLVAHKKMSKRKESWWKFMSKSAFLPDRGVKTDRGISFTSKFDIN